MPADKMDPPQPFSLMKLPPSGLCKLHAATWLVCLRAPVEEMILHDGCLMGVLLGMKAVQMAWVGLPLGTGASRKGAEMPL